MEGVQNQKKSKVEKFHFDEPPPKRHRSVEISSFGNFWWNHHHHHENANVKKTPPKIAQKLFHHQHCWRRNIKTSWEWVWQWRKLKTSSTTHCYVLFTLFVSSERQRRQRWSVVKSVRKEWKWLFVISFSSHPIRPRLYTSLIYIVVVAECWKISCSLFFFRFPLTILYYSLLSAMYSLTSFSRILQNTYVTARGWKMAQHLS